MLSEEDGEARTERIKDMETEIYRRIYFGGIEHQLRKEVTQ